MSETLALVTRAGRAIVRSGETFYMLTVDEPEPRPADGTHWTHQRALAKNHEIMLAGEYPFAKVHARMRELWREQLGLDLSLFCLDRSFNDTFRGKTAGALEQMLDKEPWLNDRLREVLLSIEPPAEADIVGATTLANVVGAFRVARLFDELLAARDTIAAVVTAWRSAVKTLATPAERAESLVAADRTRATAKAVIAMRTPSPAALDELRIWCRNVLEPEVKKATPDGPALIERWLVAIERARTATRDALAFTDTSALAIWLSDRLRSINQVAGVDRCHCDAVVRAVEHCVGGEDRARFAEAVLSLLSDLVVRPAVVHSTAEWPAGLFVVIRHVAWTSAELETARRLLVSVLYHLRRNHSWSLGTPSHSLLGSAVLEAHRTARFVGLDAGEHREALLTSLARLAPNTKNNVDPEFGCLLGVLSSYGATDARLAIRHLAQIDIVNRTMALEVVEREHRAWVPDTSSLVEALLGVFGGVGPVPDIYRPTAEEQRWAATAVHTLGALSTEHRAHVDHILVPEPAVTKRTTKAPPFATGIRRIA